MQTKAANRGSAQRDALYINNKREGAACFKEAAKKFLHKWPGHNPPPLAWPLVEELFLRLPLIPFLTACKHIIPEVLGRAACCNVLCCFRETSSLILSENPQITFDVKIACSLPYIPSSPLPVIFLYLNRDLFFLPPAVMYLPCWVTFPPLWAMKFYKINLYPRIFFLLLYFHETYFIDYMFQIVSQGQEYLLFFLCLVVTFFGQFHFNAV